MILMIIFFFLELPLTFFSVASFTFFCFGFPACKNWSTVVYYLFGVP